LITKQTTNTLAAGMTMKNNWFLFKAGHSKL